MTTQTHQADDHAARRVHNVQTVESYFRLLVVRDCDGWIEY